MDKYIGFDIDSLEDAFRLNRRIEFETAASCSACGGQTATSFLMAHSRPSAGPSRRQLLARRKMMVCRKRKEKFQQAA